MDNPEKLPTYGTEDEEKHNIICVVHQHTQTNTNNVNKTRALLQKTGGKDKPNIFFIFLFWILIFFDSKCPFVVPCFFLSSQFSSQFSTFYYFFLRKFQTHAHRIVFLCKIISVFHTFYMSTGLSSSARSSVSSIRCTCPPDCLPLQDHQCLPYVLHAHRIVLLYKIISVFHTFYMPTGLFSSARSSVSSIRFTCPSDCLPVQVHQCLPYVLHAHRIVFLYKIISVFHTFYMPTGLSSSTRSTVSSMRFVIHIYRCP